MNINFIYWELFFILKDVIFGYIFNPLFYTHILKLTCCSFFSIQGVITTRKDVDREEPGLAVDADGRGVFTLMVDATDHGSPVQRTSATVIQ